MYFFTDFSTTPCTSLDGCTVGRLFELYFSLMHAYLLMRVDTDKGWYRHANAQVAQGILTTLYVLY